MKAILFASTILALSSAIPASAEDMIVNHGHIIEIGSVTGSIYYTKNADDYLVVATLSGAQNAQPVRTSVRLGDGDAMTLEIPGAVGTVSQTVVIERNGETVSVGPQVDLRASLVSN